MLHLDPGTLALASLRVLALFVAAPLFGNPGVPMRLRVAFGLGVALVVSPPEVATLRAQMPGGELASAVLLEVVIGASLGFAARLVFIGVGMVGQIVALQGGLGAAMAVDPTSNASSGALAALLRTTAFLIFLAIDGHHALIRVLATSYVALPLGGAHLAPEGFLGLFGLGSVIFELGVRMAAPVMVAMFCANLSVGILGRAMPQLNLITLQLPAMVGVTFLLIGLGAGELSHWLAAALHGWPERVLSVLAVEG